MDQWLASVVTALITAVAAIAGAWVQAGRTAKKVAETEALPLEHRLSLLEANQKHIKENMFNNEDRKCLQELKTQMQFLLNFYVKEAAGALKNPPHLRVVLDAMASTGYLALKDLSVPDKESLREYLNEQVEGPDDGRRQHARMLIGLLKLEDTCAQV